MALNAVAVVGRIRERIPTFGEATLEDFCFLLEAETERRDGERYIMLTPCVATGRAAKFLEQYSRPDDLVSVSGQLAVMDDQTIVLCSNVDNIDTRSIGDRQQKKAAATG